MKLFHRQSDKLGRNKACLWFETMVVVACLHMSSHLRCLLSVCAFPSCFSCCLWMNQLFVFCWLLWHHLNCFLQKQVASQIRSPVVPDQWHDRTAAHWSTARNWLATTLILFSETRPQSALWPSLLHHAVFGLKCVPMAANDLQLGLS